MLSLAVYNPADSAFYREWENSWRSQGFRPGLITPKEILRHGSARAAAQARGATLLCSARTINVSFKRPRKSPVRISFVTVGKRGWRKAPVIRYPADAPAPL